MIYMPGLRGAFGNDPRGFFHFLGRLAEACTWSVLGLRQFEFPFVTLGMALGGNVRVGMEDNVYYRRGEKVRNNAQLVERVVQIAKGLGRERASPKEARRILEIGN